MAAQPIEGTREMKIVFAACCFMLTAGIACAGPAEDVHARFEEWIRTFNSHDADRLSQLYDQDARLLSTGGNEKPLDGRETIRVYFIPFMKRGDTVAFDHDDSVKVFGDTAVETGTASKKRKRSQSPAAIGDGRSGPCSRNGERMTMPPCLARGTREYAGRDFLLS